MLYDVTMRVEIDLGELAKHDGDRKPPPNELDEWYDTDVTAALDLGLAELPGEQLVSIRPTS